MSMNGKGVVEKLQSTKTLQMLPMRQKADPTGSPPFERRQTPSTIVPSNPD